MRNDGQHACGKEVSHLPISGLGGGNVQAWRNSTLIPIAPSKLSLGLGAADNPLLCSCAHW